MAVTCEELVLENGRGLAVSMRAYCELTKPRITLLVVLTSVAAFCLGAEGRIDYGSLLCLIAGVGLLSSGIGTLNQYLERDLDGKMRRTSGRPLPAGKVRPGWALVFGVLLSLTATVLLAFLINTLTAVLGLATLASYLFIYTPLKTRSSLSTVVGAVPGAMPPVLGWTAARGDLTIEAYILFAILFLWQFPHFLAIAWLYREDYAAAGVRMLPVVEPDGLVTARQIVNYTLMLVPISLLPAVVGLAGGLYLAGALALGIGFLYFSARAAAKRSKWQARRLLLASVLYLPALFTLMVVGK